MNIRAWLAASSLPCAFQATSLLAAPADLRVGQPFPNLVLPSMRDGRPMSIADFRGRKVVLHVFASW